MSLKRLVDFYTPLLVVIVAAGVGATCLWRFHDYRVHERNLRQFEKEVLTADAIEDNAEAVRAYERLSSSPPEIQLRIVQRQWLTALDLIQRIQRSKYNTVLAKDVPVLYDDLVRELEEMRDRCGVLLTESGAADEVLWQAYNISAAARLLTAFAVLETERNWPKVLGIIKESLTDLKAAIETVDGMPGTTPEKNVPRWNLELLYDRQYVQKFSLFDMHDHSRMDLNDNLEMLIPERGGYAPGEPADRSIKK